MKLTIRIDSKLAQAIDKLAAADGLTKTDIYGQLLAAGLRARIAPPEAPASTAPAQATSASPVELVAVFPPNLSALLVEIAARVNVIGAHLKVDNSNLAAHRQAFSKEFL